MTETLSWAYGEHLAREIVQLAWLDRANSDMAALTQATAQGDTKRAAALLAQLQESQPKQAQPRRGARYVGRRRILPAHPGNGESQHPDGHSGARQCDGRPGAAESNDARRAAFDGQKRAGLPDRAQRRRLRQKGAVRLAGNGRSQPIRPRRLRCGRRDLAGCQARQPVAGAKGQGARGGIRTHVHVRAAPADP